MRPLMPREKECVRCGKPIEGPGRIDRIYCSQACNNGAWRLRTGKRWGGRTSPAPNLKLRDRRTRGALLRRARGMRAELTATRLLIASQRILLAEAQQKLTAERQTIAELRAEHERERAAWTAERERLAADRAAEQKRTRTAEEESEQWYQLWHSEYKDSASRESAYRESRAGLQARVAQAENELRVANQNRQTLERERDALLTERAERMVAERAAATEAEAQAERLREKFLFAHVRFLLAEEGAAADATAAATLQRRCEVAETELLLSEKSTTQLVEERDSLSVERSQLKKQLKHLESDNRKAERALAARTQQANQLSVRLWRELLAWQQANEHNFQVATVLLGALQQANAQNDVQTEENRRLLGECHALIEVATRMDTTIRRFRWAEVRRRNQPQIKEPAQAPVEPAPKKSKPRRSASSKKRQPASVKKDNLLPVMKKKVELERRKARKQGFFAKARQSLLDAARAAARQAREGFFSICGGVAAAWVVKGVLLDSRSERTLLAEQKKEVLWLERQLEPITWSATAKRAA